MQTVLKIANEKTRNVLNRVLPNAVDARCPNPPKRVLNFVPRYFQFVLVHVRHVVAEPAVECVAYFFLIRVR